MPKNPYLAAALTWQKAAMAYGQMAVTANQVIAVRTTQMALGVMKPEEAARMILEKPAAFARSFEMAARAQAASKGHAAVALAALTPLGAKTGSNARRLQRARRRAR